MSQNQNKIKVGIQGASGYTGGELIRLILKHPNCELIYAGSCLLYTSPSPRD